MLADPNPIVKAVNGPAGYNLGGLAGPAPA